MQYLPRILNINLPEHQSVFLWGPRKTGKSTYLRSKFPDSLRFDFLDTEIFFEFSKRPFLMREQLLAKSPDVLQKPIILDEVQKVPQLLDEVHWLIENRGLRFILCGSSARKLKRGRANLLGGRAWRFEMFPLVTPELEEWDILTVLNRGLIPTHFQQKHYKKSLKAYLLDYLKEEIFAEGLTRNIPAFSRFFDALGYSHGEMTNYSNIARDCGVESKTVREYYQILVDTLMGTFVEPFKKRQNRQVISKAPKFYLFDVGVAGALTKRVIDEARGELFGKAFEHFIFMEISAHRSYSETDYEIQYWRTKSGLEVDFILGGGEVAIEVKGTNNVDNKHLNPLRAFIKDHAPKAAYVVANIREERIVDKIRVIPYRKFLNELWGGKVIS
jgi:predicted AAA+ superfamily ATPase